MDSLIERKFMGIMMTQKGSVLFKLQWLIGLMLGRTYQKLFMCMIIMQD